MGTDRIYTIDKMKTGALMKNWLALEPIGHISSD